MKAGAITADQYAKNVSRINEMYKDPKAPKIAKTPQGKAYAEDAATRLLEPDTSADCCDAVPIRYQ